MKNKLKVGGLFSGIAGLELGFQRVGFQIDWMVEKDPFCQKVLAKNFPDVRRYTDVKEVGKHNLSTVDVIVGGAPCQPHSLAGKRRGAADDRDLWGEYKRVVTELNPTWLVFENVPGIASSVFNTNPPKVESKTITRYKDQDIFTRIYTQEESLYLNHIKEDIENLGYEVAILYIPACGFNAPHKRERVFVVAYAKNGGALWGRRVKKNDASEGKTRGSSRGRSGKNDRSQTLPNPHNQRCNGREASAGETGGRLTSDGSGGTMADSKSAGLEGRTIGEIRGQEFTQRSGGSVKSRLGNCADGIPSGLAGCGVDNFWVGNWEEGIPRTISESLPGRTNKLKALGNAVVPQVAEFIARQILAVISDRGMD